MFSNSCFENRAVFEINVEKYCRDGQAAGNDTMGCLRFACYLPQATHTHKHTHTHIM